MSGRILYGGVNIKIGVRLARLKFTFFNCVFRPGSESFPIVLIFVNFSPVILTRIPFKNIIKSDVGLLKGAGWIKPEKMSLK